LDLIAQIGTFLIFFIVYALLYAFTRFTLEFDEESKKFDDFDKFKLKNLLLMPIFLTLMSYYNNSDIPPFQQVSLFLGLCAVSIFLTKLLFASHNLARKSDGEIVLLFLGANIQFSFYFVLIGGLAFCVSP